MLRFTLTYKISCTFKETLYPSLSLLLVIAKFKLVPSQFFDAVIDIYANHQTNLLVILRLLEDLTSFYGFKLVLQHTFDDLCVWVEKFLLKYM